MKNSLTVSSTSLNSDSLQVADNFAIHDFDIDNRLDVPHPISSSSEYLLFSDDNESAELVQQAKREEELNSQTITSEYISSLIQPSLDMRDTEKLGIKKSKSFTGPGNSYIEKEASLLNPEKEIWNI
jgi:hypothetical protein